MNNYKKLLDDILFEATEQDVAKRIPLWVDKYGISRDQINDAISADPTNGKYSEWIIKQIKKGTIIFPEDQDKIRNNLKLFHAKKTKLANKDINYYSPGSLARALDQQLGLTKAERKAARHGDLNVPPGARLALSEGPFDVVIIGSDDLDLSVKAANVLSSGTEWCTANPSHANRYLKQGPLYLIYENGVRKYLVHYPSDQFKDVYDDEVNGPLREYTKQRYEYEGKSTEDIKGKIISLLYPLTGIAHHQVASYALAYCISAGRRWPEAEQYLLGSRDTFKSAISYAEKILENRWPDLEQLLLNLEPENEWDSKPSELLSAYANLVLKPLGFNRWPEAEPTILNNNVYAIYYAANVMASRWTALEDKLLEKGSANLLSYYAIRVIKNRWPEAEPTILKKGGEPLGEYINAFNLRYSHGLGTESTMRLLPDND